MSVCVCAYVGEGGVLNKMHGQINIVRERGKEEGGEEETKKQRVWKRGAKTANSCMQT